MLSTTAFLAVAMQCAATVHPSTSLDVARVESGYNPYAIAEIVPKHERNSGDKGFITHMPKSKEDAISITNQIEAKGRRYSIGLMQITSTNFKRYGVTATDLFNPCINLSVYEKIITDCYLRGGTLKRALSCYYSGNFDTGQKPEAAFSKTSYVQRMGYKPAPKYVVPSSKADQEKQNATPGNAAPTPQIRYPKGIVRGDLITSDAQASPNQATPVSFPSQVVRGEFVVTTSK